MFEPQGTIIIRLLNGRVQLCSEEVTPRRKKTPHPASPRKAGARSYTSTIVHGDLVIRADQRRGSSVRL